MKTHVAQPSGQAPIRRRKFKIGDIVSFINSYGCKFPERMIIGFDDQCSNDEFRYFIQPNSAHWYSIHESQLILDAEDPVVEVIGGHKIRKLPSESEDWFLVGTTNSIFRHFERAKDFALLTPAQAMIFNPTTSSMA